MTSQTADSIHPVRCGRGRALYAQPDGALYCSLHYDIFRSKDDGRTWQRLTSIPRSFTRRIIEPSRLLCRLLRHEVRGLIPLPDESCIAATRTGVFRSEPGERWMRPARIEAGRIPVECPMTISADPHGRIVWGEYWGNAARRGVRILASDDLGKTYHVAYSFAKGETRHVHNILYDAGLDSFWVLCGDHGSDAGVGLLDVDFRHFEWVAKGEQRFRAVCAFDLGNRLIYATDTEMESNGIYALNKATGRAERIIGVDGSCIYATRCGGHYVISTTAEPLKGHAVGQGDDAASIWISHNAYDWRRIFTRSKDRWSYKYFQFGSLVLPRGGSNCDVLLFSGQAIQEIDGIIFTTILPTNAA